MSHEATLKIELGDGGTLYILRKDGEVLMSLVEGGGALKRRTTIHLAENEAGQVAMFLYHALKPRPVDG